MKADVVDTGIDVMGAVRWGTHFCQFYRTTEDLLQALVPYFRAGLQGDESCLWITCDPLTPTEAANALGQAVPDLAARLSRGQIEILPHTAWYLADGGFSIDRVLHGWMEKLDRARSAGYRGLRLAGDTAWLEEKERADFARYEAAVAGALGDHRMLALCSYSLDRCGAAEVLDVLRHHGFALMRRNGRWELIETAAYQQAQRALAASERKYLGMVESLRQSEERYRGLYQSVAGGIVVQDENGVVTESNAQAREILGLTYDEIAGRTSFNPEWQAHREDGSPFPGGEHPAMVALRTGQSVRDVVMGVFNPELREHRWILVNAEPIRDSSTGRVTAVATTFGDITERLAADLSLRESEEKYRIFFQNMAEGFALYELLYDQDGRPCDWRILEVNDAYTEHTGLPRDHVVGQRAGTVFPRAVPQYLPIFSRVVASQTPERFDTHAEGVGRYLHVTTFPAGGRRFASVFEDNSKLAEAERQTRILADTAGELLRSASPEMVVEGLCTRVMQHLDCQVFFNFVLDEPSGRLRLNAFAGISAQQAREVEWLDYGVNVCGCVARDRCRMVAENIFENPDPRTELVRSYGVQAYACHPLIAQDHLLGTLSFGARARPRFTPEELSLMKAVADLVAIAMQRKRTKDELREMGSYLDSLLNYANAPIIVWDPQLRITKFNRAFQRLTGHAEAEVLGQHLSMLFPPASSDDSLSHIRRTATGEYWESVEIPILRVDGAVRTVLWNSANIYAPEGGELVATIAQGQDITERKEAEAAIRTLNDSLRQRAAELEVANKELEAFAYSVSHDLRTPLRSIDGFSLALLEDCWDKIDDQGKDYLHRVREASQTMAQLIDDMLDLSRVTRAEIHWKEVDLSSIARRIARTLQDGDPERNVDFTIAPGLRAHGDPALLRVALENLLGNAWKFTGKRERARIEFGAVRGKDPLVYCVRDNGVGFDSNYAGKLFEPFQRLHSRKEFPGTGVGLATVKRIVNRHGGQIWAEGRVGGGATFFFTLNDHQ